MWVRSPIESYATRQHGEIIEVDDRRWIVRLWYSIVYRRIKDSRRSRYRIFHGHPHISCRGNGDTGGHWDFVLSSDTLQAGNAVQENVKQCSNHAQRHRHEILTYSESCRQARHIPQFTLPKLWRSGRKSQAIPARLSAFARPKLRTLGK